MGAIATTVLNSRRVSFPFYLLTTKEIINYCILHRTKYFLKIFFFGGRKRQQLAMAYNCHLRFPLFPQKCDANFYPKNCKNTWSKTRGFLKFKNGKGSNFYRLHNNIAKVAFSESAQKIHIFEKN